MRQHLLSVLAVIGILVRSTLSAACSDGDKQCLTSGCSMWCSKWTCKKEGCEGCDEKIGCDPHSPPPPSPPPLPALPPWDVQGVSGILNVFAHEGRLYANGERLHIKGVNWFGSEGRSGPPLGLDKHQIAWYMRFLKENQFNAIRFLFNHQAVLEDAKLEPPNEAKYGKGAPWEAPELQNYAYVDMFKKLAEVAAEHGILVMVACHRLKPDAWPGEGLWYDAQITEAKVLQSWTKMAGALCGQWNVFAADLQNEPHASSWGKGDQATDWGLAAGRIGNHILQACSRWMIFVEGVGFEPGAPGMDSGGAGIWWGENMAGAKTRHVALSDMSKLVYSPHTYGPSVYNQKYFTDGDFPRNMPTIWGPRFAYLVDRGYAVCVGEMGGFYVGKDKEWQDWAFNFMKEKGIGFFYFALNPGSKDTGGLLRDDWVTPETSKLEMLSSMPTTDILVARAKSLLPPHPPLSPPPVPSSPPSPQPPRPELPPGPRPPPGGPSPPPPEPPDPSPPPPEPPDPSPPRPWPPGHASGMELRVDASTAVTKAEAAAAAWRAASTLGQPLSANGKSAGQGAWYSDLTLLFPLGGASVGLVVLGAWCAASGDGPRRRKKGRTLVSQVDEDDLLQAKKLTKTKKATAKKKNSTPKSGKMKEKARTSSFMGFPLETA